MHVRYRTEYFVTLELEKCDGLGFVVFYFSEVTDLPFVRNLISAEG